MKIGNVKRAQSIVGRSEGRPANDFYPTPPYATHALLDNCKFMTNMVWEPACGDGAISKVLLERGFDVLSTDLYSYSYANMIPGVDFLSYSAWGEDVIITNPPYKLAEKFVWHAYDIGIKQLALLLKLSFLEGQGRSKLFEAHPPSKVMVFKKRLTMTRGGEPLRGGGMIAFAWYFWDFRLPRYPPTLHWI